MSGVVPSSAARFGLAPASASTRITSTSAAIAASRNGVAPGKGLTPATRCSTRNWLYPARGGIRSSRASGSAPWSSRARTNPARSPGTPRSPRHSASRSVAMPFGPLNSVCQDPAAQWSGV